MAAVTEFKTARVDKNPDLSALPSIDFSTEDFEPRTTARREDISLFQSVAVAIAFLTVNEFNPMAATFFEHITKITTH